MGQAEQFKSGDPLRHTTPKNMALAGHFSGLLIQALREIGKENIIPERIEHLKRIIPPKPRGSGVSHRLKPILQNLLEIRKTLRFGVYWLPWRCYIKLYCFQILYTSMFS